MDLHRDLGLVDRRRDLDSVGLRWVHLYWVGHRWGLGLVDRHLGHGKGPLGGRRVLDLSGDHQDRRWVREKVGRRLGRVKAGLRGHELEGQDCHPSHHHRPVLLQEPRFP